MDDGYSVLLASLLSSKDGWGVPDGGLTAIEDRTSFLPREAARGRPRSPNRVEKADDHGAVFKDCQAEIEQQCRGKMTWGHHEGTKKELENGCARTGLS